jgi:hypothetical protein
MHERGSDDWGTTHLIGPLPAEVHAAPFAVFELLLLSQQLSPLGRSLRYTQDAQPSFAEQVAQHPAASATFNSAMALPPVHDICSRSIDENND